MTRFYTIKGGKKVVKGKEYEKVVGSRAEVWHNVAHHTKGGLLKCNLTKNKRGRIVSLKKSLKAAKKFCLLNYKGKRRSGCRKKLKSKRCRSRRRRTMKGGNGVNYTLSPAPFDGKGVGTSGVDLQFVAGNAA